MNKIRTTLDQEYFEWIRSKIGESPLRRSYILLLTELHSQPFRYTMAMDENRYEDGIALRYTFGEEKGISDYTIANTIDLNKPCSILEMILAVAIKCEIQIMSNDDFGDRTGIWFWSMLENMTLTRADDNHYDEERVIFVIDRFLQRDYDQDGYGGLFITNSSKLDMRIIDIWYQLNEWLLENYVL